jgi:hypothetical protein
LVVEAVIGTRDAGKTKKPPETDSLYCESRKRDYAIDAMNQLYRHFASQRFAFRD